MGTPLGPKYIPYTYMDPLGSLKVEVQRFRRSRTEVLDGGPGLPSQTLATVQGLGFRVWDLGFGI